MSALERAFLDASLGADLAEQAAARRRVRRMRRLVALLSLLLTLTSIAMVVAVRAQHRADQQRDIATSRRVAEQVRALRSADPALSLQLSLAAYRLAPTVEARSSLLSAFTTPYATELAGHRGDVPVLFSPDGRLLATGHAGGVRLWDATRPHRPRAVGAVPAGQGGPVLTEATRATAFSPDGRLLLAGGGPDDPKARDGAATLQLWDISDPRHPRRLSTRHTSVPLSAAFSPDGRTLATVGQDGVLRLWSPSHMHGLRPMTGLRPAVGMPPVTGVPGGHVKDIGRLTSVAFSPDGRTLAAGSTDCTVRRWDVTRPRRPRPLPPLRGHCGVVASVAFSPERLRPRPGSGQLHRERNALAVGDDVVIAARACAVDRAGAAFGPLRAARTSEETHPANGPGRLTCSRPCDAVGKARRLRLAVQGAAVCRSGNFACESA
ncbi:WD40 repeat domain-containing protein [Streptomyces sp. NPDC003015]